MLLTKSKLSGFVRVWLTTPVRDGGVIALTIPWLYN